MEPPSEDSWSEAHLFPPIAGGSGEDLRGSMVPRCWVEARGTLCRGAEPSGRADLLVVRGGRVALIVCGPSALPRRPPPIIVAGRSPPSLFRRVEGREGGPSLASVGIGADIN